jgi:hypothetical protein
MNLNGYLLLQILFVFLDVFFTSTSLGYSLLSMINRAKMLDLSGIWRNFCTLVNHFLGECISISRLMLIICKHKTEGV